MITPRDAVLKMQAYHPPLEGRRSFVRLDFNENVAGCSPRLIEALKTIDAREIATYPEYGALRQKLSAFFRLPESCLLPTNASDEGILTVFQTYLNAGDELILPVPTFAMFSFYAELLGLALKTVLYNEDLSFPACRIEAAVTEKTKALVLINPNNPTGTRIDRDFIVRMLERLGDRLLLLDEAYVEFSGESAIDLIDRYKNLVILRTFSKSFGMAGLRLGTVLSCAENIENLSKAHSPYSISGVTVKLAMAALDDADYVARYAREAVKSRGRIEADLTARGIPVFPSRGNFVLARFGARSREIEAALKSRGILVRDRSSDPLLSGCLRITTGTDAETERLIKALNELKGTLL